MSAGFVECPECGAECPPATKRCSLCDAPLGGKPSSRKKRNRSKPSPRQPTQWASIILMAACVMMGVCLLLGCVLSRVFFLFALVIFVMATSGSAAYGLYDKMKQSAVDFEGEFHPIDNLITAIAAGGIALIGLAGAAFFALITLLALIWVWWW